MNYDEAVRFAKSSARDAYDQRDAYDDPIGSFRDNITDTMNDEGDESLSCYVARDRVMEVYDAEIARLFPERVGS